MDIKANVNLFNRPEGNLKGLASISINDDFIVRGIRVIEGEKGLFVSMPSQKVGSDYRDVCFAKSTELREQINKTVLEAYEQTLKQEQKTSKGAKEEKKQTKSVSHTSKQKEVENAEKQSIQEEQTDEGPVMSM